MKTVLRKLLNRLPARLRLIVETGTLLVLQRLLFRLKARPPQGLICSATSAEWEREVAKKGYVVIPGFKSAEWCERALQEIASAMSSTAVTTRHTEDLRIFGVENLCPTAREFACDPTLTAAAASYASSDEVLVFCMANRVEYRAGVAYGSGGEWHRDSFRRELKAMLYLTDVAERDGPFAMVRASHHWLRIAADVLRLVLGRDREFFRRASSTRLLDAGVYLNERSPGRTVALTAARGTLLLFDTSAIHTGLLPQPGGSVRVALTNYYCAKADVPAVRAYYTPHVKLN